MSVIASVAMTVPLAVAMAVAVSMHMRVRLTGSRANSSILLQFLDASGMNRPRVRAGGLDTGVRQQFEDGLEILLGTLWRPGESDEQRSISDASNRS